MNIIKSKIKEIIPAASTYLLLFICVILIVIFSRYNSLAYDDFIECSYRLNEGIFDSLLPIEKINGGGYTCIFLTKLTTLGIPYLFNIHPQDYLFKIAPIIKGILYSLFFFVSVKCFLIRNKNKWLFFTALIFIMFYLLSDLYFSNCMCIKDNITFFRYVFTTMFYTILLSYTYKNIIFRNLKFSFKEGLLVFLCVIVTASNLETIIYVFCSYFALLIGYNFLIDFLYLFKKFKYSKSIYKYNLNFKFWVPVCLFYIIALVYIYSPRYWDNFNGRGFGSFNFNIKDILEFFNIFYSIYIQENIVYWTILLILIFIYLFKKKSILDKKKLISILFMLISIVLIYFSLIIFGKNGYDGSFWITDIKLIIFFNIMVLSPIFILLDDFLKHTNNRIKKLYVTLISSFLFLISIFYIVEMYNNRYLKSDIYVFQKVNYINEKMYRYFIMKNQTPYLIKINPNPDDWMPFLFLEILQNEENYLEKNKICSYDESRTTVYLEKVYNDKGYRNTKFCLSDDALDRFFNLGGVIYKDELENIRFEKLKNSEYILKNNEKSEPIMSKDEIIAIYKSLYR